MKLYIVAAILILTSIAAAEVPESVEKFEALAANPELRKLFIGENAPMDAGPIYVAPCDKDSETMAAYGCIDICAAIDHYDKSGETGYIPATPELIGKPNFQHILWVHDNYPVQMYFTTVETHERCLEMLEAETLIVAYGGWCTAGVVDEKPHFSSPNKAPYMVKRYGEKTVVFFTNMAKMETPATPENEKIASEFLSALTPDSILDIRGKYVPVLLDDYTGYQPPKEGVDWALPSQPK